MEKMRPENKKHFEQINSIILEISKSLNKFDLNEFSRLVARYNRKLNLLLSTYHQNKELQRKLKPYIMFYRQFFQELIEIVRAESIQEEKLALLKKIISQKSILIKNYYQAQAEREIENIEKVSQELDEYLKKRLEKERKLNYYT